MRRRDKTGIKTAKTQRRKTLKRRSTAVAARRRKSFAVDATKRIALLEHRLSESLEQQTATTEVLRVISSSEGELEPVFQTLLANATRLCMADFGFMFQYNDGFFQLMAQRERMRPPQLAAS